MRQISTLSMAAVLAAAAILLGTQRPPAAETVSLEPEATPDARGATPFVVHEWGTFTTFSGSDGVKLEFRPLLDNDLPPFVVNRARQFGELNPFIKSSIPVLARMETPVTYFYTDREREVGVRVGFPKGLLTEFYPPVVRMEPPFKWFEKEPIADSVLDWGKVWLIPPAHLGTHVQDGELAQRVNRSILSRLLPHAAEQNHYAYARETDSAVVYVQRQADPHRPLTPFGDFFEKFLFYRGVGNFDLPLSLESLGDGRFELTNTGPDDVRSLFLVTVEGERVQYRRYEGIEAGGTLILEQAAETSTVDQLAEEVVAALVAEKLYEKEARAMVKTWRASWFGEQGTRLFYMLPRPVTDELLPLETDPQPDEVVRVMVGRMEIMTPEDETRIMELVRASAAERATQAAAEKDAPPFPAAVLQMGRLAEPALVRVKNIADDEAIRNEAALLLEQLNAARETAS